METAWKCVKTSPRNLAVESWQCTLSHFLLHQGIIYQKQHGCHPPHTLHTWLGPLRIFCFPNWGYRHFDTTEMVTAESQAVLNTLAENDFQDEF
jgi:hypothetical protein